MAVIGLGHAGSRYADWLARGKVRGARLAAVCSRDALKMERYGANVGRYARLENMLSARAADALIVATPHAEHVASARAALEAGWHVLVEKPLAARWAEAQELVAAHEEGGGVPMFAIMLNLRMVPAYQTIRTLIRGGDLGRVRRVHWTFTDWYRTEAYFRSSWRGTWAGEGGGLLINQTIHHTDLLQWWLGKPAAVFARASWGKYHRIEVEDEVFAWWRYKDDLTVSLVFSTGEAPGFNRLEIVGDNGTLEWNGTYLIWHKLEHSLPEYTANCDEPDEKPTWQSKKVCLKKIDSSHIALLQNFVNGIRVGEALLTPAAEGLASLELANAMQLSCLVGKEIALPLDAVAFDKVMSEKMAMEQRSAHET